jgi:hypothetical protein
MALHEHLGQVFQRYMFDQHRLKLEDIQRANRQNWASSQRMCQAKIRTCLRLLQTTLNVYMVHTLGTEMYLGICSNYIDIFLSPRLDLRSRIVPASKVSFLFRLWRLWFSHGDQSVFGNTKKLCPTDHFVSQQCFINIQCLVTLLCYSSATSKIDIPTCLSLYT